jgi:hypothetical protein
MRRWIPILAVLAGLWSFFFIRQGNAQEIPFDRYLAGLKTNRPEAALVQFAADCGVDVAKSVPRYAQSSSDRWILVKDLSKALKDQETDFYATLSVWHEADRIFVEQWGMELDTGTYGRQFICLQNRKILFAEGIDWTIPPISGKSQRASYPAWGYEQRWKVGIKGKWEKVSSRFVDAYEKPIKESSIAAEDRKDLDWKWAVYTWRDLEFPSALLR